MKGLRIIALCLPVLWTNLLSQKLSHQVLVPAASVVIATNNYTVAQSIGEVMIQTGGDSFYAITQGFQQLLSFGEIDSIIYGAWVYPNPARDFITVKINGDKTRNYRIDFMDLTGRVFISEKKSFVCEFEYEESFNVSTLLGGLYLVRIMTDDGLFNRIFRIQKI